MANVFLTREQDFDHHAAHILQFDRYLGLLTESCQRAPQLAAAIQEFEVGPWSSDSLLEECRAGLGWASWDLSQTYGVCQEV